MANVQRKTSFTFDYFHPTSNNLIYQGDAHVPTDTSLLRLTKTDVSSGSPAPHSVGRVLYSPPLQFWEPGSQASFETTIKFFITPINETPADGIAFFIAPVNFPIGANGGSLGIFDASSDAAASSIFAVEIDTYPNREWDPGFPHIGININSRKSENAKRFDDALLKDVTVHIKYTPNTKRISVVATTDSGTFTVEHVADLKAKFLRHQRVQVGISAATGEQVAIHDILSWSFTSNLVSDGGTVARN